MRSSLETRPEPATKLAATAMAMIGVHDPASAPFSTPTAITMSPNSE